jgi:hypothetical protein
MKTKQIKMIFLTLTLWGIIENANAQLANWSLSNLTYPTAINQSLLPGADTNYSLGNYQKSWNNAFFHGAIYLNGKKSVYAPNPSSIFLGNTGNSTSTGNANTAVGIHALFLNETGYQNVALGSYSLENNTKGKGNVGIGHKALLLNNSRENVGIGSFALMDATGNGNVAVGNNTGWGDFTGQYNTYIGYSAQTSVATNDNYNSTALGSYSLTSASNQVRLGDDNVVTIGGFVDFTVLPCDRRFKKNIQENVAGLAFINKLRPVTYNVNMEELEKTLYPPRTPVKDKDGNIINTDEQKHSINTEKAKIQYTGFIAQEVEQAAKDANYDFSGVDKPKNDHDLYGLRYGTFVVPLVKSVQELSKENDVLADQNAKLQKQLEEVLLRMDQFEKALSERSTGNEQLKDKAAINNLQPAILEQNAPNPFSVNSTIRFFIPASSQNALIKIMDAKQNELKAFSISERGASQITISANSFAAGNYTYQLIIDGKIIDTKRMTLTK